MLDIAGTDENVIRFFVEFSRFEYALKRCNFVKSGSGGVAEPNWNKFGSDYNPSFHLLLDDPQNQTLITAVDYLRNHPPKKLILENGSESQNLCWRRAGPSGLNLADLLTLVRRVRNNLFHGEKPRTILGGVTDDSDRGNLLVRYSLDILHACTNLDPNVQTAFLQMSRRIRSC